MNNNVETKFSVFENLYKENKKKYNKKHKIYWEKHYKYWNSKETGTLRLVKNIPKIVSKIESLDLDENSTILDICCGSPNLLNAIKTKFPNYNTYGVDVYTTKFDDYEENCSNGVKVFQFPFQMLLGDSYKNERDFDLVMMFNSYRAFDSELREKLSSWSTNNSEHSLLDTF